MIPRALYRGLPVGLVILGTAAGFAAVPGVITGPVDTHGRVTTIDVDAAGSLRDQPPAGNPLWATPLEQLSATRERPLFSPSRRPPLPPVAAAPYVLAAAVSKPVEPDRPRLELVGTIAGEREAFGIFLDQTTNKAIRLKLGEAHQGWVLRQVLRREVALQKDQDTTRLALPTASLVANAPAMHLAGDSSDSRARSGRPER
jgi:hypothetical protein